MKESSPALRVLIVDDSPEDRFVYRRGLNGHPRCPYSIIESETGEEGLTVCETTRPDCVLLDYHLPDMDGVEFLTQLRTAGNDTPVIVLTRKGNEGIAVGAMKAGAHDYLLKDTLSADSLCRAIEFAIEKAANRRERELRRQAEQANRLKDEFLATLSHEMRTPLNAILGWVTLVRSGRLPDDRIDKALETVERNARVQAKLVEDLLDVSRIISGKFRLDNQDLELGQVLEGAVDMVRPIAEEKHIRLQVTKFSIVPMKGDASRLQQAILNLLSNSVKFTPELGQVDVRLETDGVIAKISVADTGIGILPDFLPYVFDRFRQADGSTTRSHGGLGLGLAITRHIVELHGGAVCASSSGRDRGATFTISLPVN
jgi:signal transduction histidine kinase